MISRLQGILISRTPPTILIDVSGVGYEVDIPMTTLYDLPEIGALVILHTHMAVREDAQQLYGFLTESDRRLFRELIKVNGIGGRTALGILSSMNALDFIDCILQEKIAYLVKIPGIGKKTAERLIIEMRDRLQPFQNQQTNAALKVNIPQEAKNSPKDEATAALIALGYRPQEANRAIEKCFDETLSSDTLIRLALQNI